MFGAEKNRILFRPTFLIRRADMPDEEFQQDARWV